jgi:hypothetical protein
MGVLHKSLLKWHGLGSPLSGRTETWIQVRSGGAMSLTIRYSTNTIFRATLKALVFGISSFAGIFFASAGYGLLKMLLSSMSAGTKIGIAEFSTHGGLTIVFFVLAGFGGYVAKKCIW